MTLHVAIPALDEARRLPDCLADLRQQDHPDFKVWVCVNQPDAWWQDRARRPICERNQETLRSLAVAQGAVRVLDRASPGRGWPAKGGGVGAARRALVEAIRAEAPEDDLVVSLDADTRVEPDYLTGVAAVFDAHPDVHALSVPYLHRLTGDEPVDRAMLRYELYLRHYAVHLWRIGSPYAFTALGSALAFRLSALRRVGGLPARSSGEDFYLLQKLVKTGRVLHFARRRVHPAARLSDRVAFGTGPALRQGSRGEWQSYPLFAAERFDDVARTVALFPALFEGDRDTPLTPFLKKQLGTEDPWAPLRENHSDVEHFVRACHERLDGLRIFQYLRSVHPARPGADEAHLLEGLRKCFDQPVAWAGPDWRFATAPMEELDRLRWTILEIEESFRRRHARA